MEAQTQINELEYIASNLQSALSTEIREFAEIQEIIMHVDTSSTDSSFLNTINNNIVLLEYIAYNSSHMASSQAQILLSKAGIAEFDPEIFLPVNNRSLRFTLQEEENNTIYEISSLIEVYPIPASSEIWVEYLIIKDKPVSKIEVYNVEGKLVLSQSIRNEFGLERIDVSQFSEGNYILKLGEFSKQISVIK